MNFALKAFKRHAKRLIPALPRALQDLASMPISTLPTSYYHKDPFLNQQLAIYTGLVARTPALAADPELAPYRDSRPFFAFATHLSLLSEAVFYLYIAMYEDAGQTKLLNAQWETPAADLHDIRLIVAEYARLMRDTRDSPYWQGKIRDDVGKYIGLMYKMHANSPRMVELYREVDMQQLLS